MTGEGFASTFQADAKPSPSNLQTNQVAKTKIYKQRYINNAITGIMSARTLPLVGRCFQSTCWADAARDQGRHVSFTDHLQKHHEGAREGSAPHPPRQQHVQPPTALSQITFPRSKGSLWKPSGGGGGREIKTS